MRVMLLAPSWFNFYVAELAAVLAPRHDVLLVVDQYWEEWAAASGLSVPCERVRVDWHPTRRRPIANAKELRALRSLIQGWAPDVVHVQESERRFFFGWPLFRHTPTVFDFHNVLRLPGMEQPILDSFHRWVVRHVGGVVVHGHAMKSALTGRGGVDPSRIAVLPFGRFRVFGEAPPGNRLGTRESPNVLFFGRIEPYKGLSVLEDAEPMIARAFGDGFTITVVGAGDVRRQAPGLLTSPRVRIVNRRVPAAAPYFEEADIVVLPYVAASTSGVTPVAYAFAKPVVVSDVGSLPETVADGETGFVVPRGDPGRLAEAICTLLRNPELRRRMGIAGRRKLDQELAWERNIDEVERCYAHARAS